MKHLLPFFAFAAWAITGPLSAQSSPVTVAGWSFGSASFQRTSSVQHPALAPSPLILNSGGGVSLIGGAETGASSGFYAQTTNWPATESPDLASPRIGLYPATSSKVLWASFQLSPSASGDWSGLALSFRHKVATGLAAPTHARAWISWYEGTTVRTRSSPVTALSATSTAWSTLSLVFSNGSTPLPSGAALAGKSFLVEWQCFGASATSNGLAVDDWTLQAGSLTGVQPLLIRTSSLAEARVGTAYQVSCSATGGMLPYAWSISSGSLPAGLSLNAATGVISGTPTAAGARSFSLRVTDATTVTATRTMSLNVLAANATLVLGNTVWADVNQNGLRESSEPGIPGVTVRLFASTADTATATPLASTLTGSGGLYAFRNLAPGNYRVVVTPTTTYSRTGGSPVALDNGIDNDNNGLQSGGPGTPVSSPVITLAAATEPGSTGRGNEDATIDFGLAPAENATLAVQPSTLVPAITGRYYSAVFSASGGVAPYSWSLTTGTLPAGLILQSTTGLISGTVTAPAGSYAFTVRAQDASGISGTRPVTLLVSSAQITISPATLPAGRVGSAYSQTLTANGGTAPYSWSISAGTLPTGLALNSSTGLISGTPVALAATGSAFSVQTTDAAGLRAFRTYVIALEGTQLTISPSSLPPATSGMAFSQAFTAAGGAAPYVWAVASGALPAGLSLNTSTGLLSGVLTAPSATYTFGIQATGANGSRGTATLTLSVNASQSLTLGNLVWADLNGNGLKDVTETGIAGVQMRLFPATANPATATPIVTATTTSTGMYSLQVFSPGTYVVAFTPPAAYPAAASKVVTLDNGIDNDNNASQPGGPGTLVTSPPIALGNGTEPPGGGTGNADNTVDFGLVAAPVTTITISPPTLSAAMVGKPYQQALTAAGGTAPYTWAITSGTLPAGLTLNTATGMLSGTPVSISNSTFALRATDSTGVNASRSYTLGVACAPITLSPTTIPEFTVGTPATVALMASGGAAPYAWAVSGSTLPAGLTLNPATGVLSGTPTTAGTFTGSLSVIDALGCIGTRAIALTVKSNVATITISPPTLPGLVIGSPYLQTFTASGGTAPYSWAITSGSLPAGLALSTTGILSGTPTIASTSTFAVRATDANGANASRTYTLGAACAPITISPATLPEFILGMPATVTLVASGGTAPYAWAVSGSTLPAGLTLNPATGLLMGTPTTAGTFTLSIRVTDVLGCISTRSYVLTVKSNASTITISPPTLTAPGIGKPYQQALTATGGTAPYTWAVTSGSLPAGLTLNTATGMLSGTPTTISNSTFTVRATDSTGVNASRSYTLGVACAPITLSPTTIPEFTVGTPATVALMASGGAAPYAWSVSGSTLPAGLTLNAATGLLSGTPTTAGTFTLSIRVTDVLGCTSTRSFALTVKSNAATIIINPATLAAPGIGSPYQQALTATGGTAPYTWAVISGTLPAGLSLNTTNGILSGMPTIATTSTFTLRATDATTSSASRTYTLSVTSAPGTYPSSFLLWQQQNNLMGGPLDDPDADGVPNLLEYALGTPPAVCTGLNGRFALVKSNAPGTTPSTPAMHAELSMPGWPNDLVFVIEALGDLSSSPGGWMPVLRTPVLQTTSAGLIKRIWQNLNSATSTATGLLSPERGFIRLRVSLDADLNGTPEATAVTSTYGWLRSSPVAGISVSLGMPFVLPTVYSSQILAVNGTSLVLGSMAGGMNSPLPGFSDQFSGGRQFYAEILTGAAEGRRFEIDEALTLAGRGTTASGTTLVLDLASPENTGAPIAALLTGSRVAIRPHWTLASAFDPAEFLTPPPLSSTAGTPAAFHRLNALNPDGTAYTTYLVTSSTSGPKWRNPADTTAADLNGKPIRPDEGHILRVASTAPLTFTLLGQVRETAFARPLAATAQLLANPWPMPLTAAARALTSTSGFVPGASSTTADNIITFEGAIGVNTDLLRSYFLTGDTAATQTWQPVNATDPALHFPPASAAFFRPLSPRPSWFQPRPWTP